MKTKNRQAMPDIVSMDQWQAEREKLLKKEKAATGERDQLAAERRRMPMAEVEKAYTPREWTAGPRRVVLAAPSSWTRSPIWPTCTRVTPRWC
jgi:predicted dithiol-disulfide oxidoreductase (DUF899 family)